MRFPLPKVEELDGIHPAHVGLDDGHHLLIPRMGTDLG